MATTIVAAELWNFERFFVMLLDENNKPRKLWGRLEWPIALLFSVIPMLVIVALINNSAVI